MICHSGGQKISTRGQTGMELEDGRWLGSRMLEDTPKPRSFIIVSSYRECLSMVRVSLYALGSNKAYCTCGSCLGIPGELLQHHQLHSEHTGHGRQQNLFQRRLIRRLSVWQSVHYDRYKFDNRTMMSLRTPNTILTRALPSWLQVYIQPRLFYKPPS